VNENNLKADKQNCDGPVDNVDDVQEVAGVRIEHPCDDGKYVEEEGEGGGQVEQHHVRLHLLVGDVLVSRFANVSSPNEAGDEADDSKCVDNYVCHFCLNFRLKTYEKSHTF
jgi:hypothetical protein